MGLCSELYLTKALEGVLGESTWCLSFGAVYGVHVVSRDGIPPLMGERLSVLLVNLCLVFSNSPSVIRGSCCQQCGTRRGRELTHLHDNFTALDGYPKVLISVPHPHPAQVTKFYLLTSHSTAVHLIVPPNKLPSSAVSHTHVRCPHLTGCSGLPHTLASGHPSSLHTPASGTPQALDGTPQVPLNLGAASRR